MCRGPFRPLDTHRLQQAGVVEDTPHDPLEVVDGQLGVVDAEEQRHVAPITVGLDGRLQILTAAD